MFLGMLKIMKTIKIKVNFCGAVSFLNAFYFG
jgi:hypothetical protein